MDDLVGWTIDRDAAFDHDHDLCAGRDVQGQRRQCSIDSGSVRPRDDHHRGPSSEWRIGAGGHRLRRTVVGPAIRHDIRRARRFKDIGGAGIDHAPAFGLDAFLEPIGRGPIVRGSSRSALIGELDDLRGHC